MTQAAINTSLFLTPTVVIGLGGTGVETVRLVKERINSTPARNSSAYQFLAVDTEPCPNYPGRERIFSREFAYIGGYDMSEVIRNLSRYPEIQQWWPQNQSLAGAIYRGARQKRIIGRLSLYVKWYEFKEKLERKLEQVNHISEKERLQLQQFNVDRSGRTKVYIISSICGGTGSGTFLDVAYKVRANLGPRADIVGILLMPSCFRFEMQSDIQKRRIQANAYAALMEVNHWTVNPPFHAAFPLETPQELGKSFDRMFLIEKSNGQEYLSSLSAIRDMVAQFVYLDSITPMGEQAASKGVNVSSLAEEDLSLMAGSASNGTAHAAAVAVAPAATPAVLPTATPASRQSLGYGSFATASLILPFGEYRDQALSILAAELAHSEVIPTLAADAVLRLEKRAANFAYRLKDDLALRDKTVQSGKSQQHPIKLSLLPAVYKGLLDLLADDLQQIVREHRLRGVLSYARNLERELLPQRTDILAKIDEAQQRVQQMMKTLGELERERTGRFMEVVDFVTSFLYRLIRVKTPTERREAAKQAERVRLEQQLEAQNLVLQRNERAYDALRQIIDSVHALHDTLQVLVNDLQRETAAALQLGQSVPVAQANGLDGVWELATYVRTDGNQRYVSDRLLPQIKNKLPDNIATRIVSGLMKPHVEPLLTTNSMGLDIQLVIEYLRTSQAIREHIMDELRAAFGPTLYHDIRISEYFAWFYEHIPYGRTSSRNSPIDPLLVLRNRIPSQRPIAFINLTPERLGNVQANIEPVRILGVDALDPLNEDIFDEFDTFDRVPTGRSERVDLSVAIYGFPLNALAELAVMKGQYEQFQGAPYNEHLHLANNWTSVLMAHII